MEIQAKASDLDPAPRVATTSVLVCLVKPMLYFMGTGYGSTALQVHWDPNDRTRR